MKNDNKSLIWTKLISILVLSGFTLFLAGHISYAVNMSVPFDSIADVLLIHIKRHPFDFTHYNRTVFIYCTGILLIGVIGILSAVSLPHGDMKGIEKGSNNFMNRHELREFIRKNTTPIIADNAVKRETNLLLSEGVKISYNTRLTKLGSMNTLVVGGTGEGKSRGFVRPNLYSLPVDSRTEKPMSFVICDPKGELCRDTAGFLEDNGYEIKIFNLYDQYYSDCYNPFRYIRDTESLIIMVDSIVDNANGGRKVSDPHWPDSAKTLLCSICYTVYCEFAFKDQNFTTVSRLLNMCGSSENDDNYKSDYDLLINELEENSELGAEHPAVVWRRKVAAKGSEMSSIISTAQTAIRMFASEDIRHLTDVDTMSIDEIGDRPTALYIIISTTNRTYDFLISLLYSQLFESLFYRAQSIYDGALPHHVTFFQDEFATTGKIPDFDRKIATFRSVNISTCVIVQSPNQIKSLYESAYPNIIDNMHQYVYLGSGGVGEDSASKWMETILGHKTVLVEQANVKSSSLPGLFGAKSEKVDYSYSPSDRPLHFADEIFRMDPQYSIVLIKGQKPVIRKKINLDKCMNFSSRKYSCRTKEGRVLRNKYVWAVNDKNPHSPARRRTVDSYKEGLKRAHDVDILQQKQRIHEAEEREHYKNQRDSLSDE